MELIVTASLSTLDFALRYQNGFLGSTERADLDFLLPCNVRLQACGLQKVLETSFLALPS